MRLMFSFQCERDHSSLVWEGRRVLYLLQYIAFKMFGVGISWPRRLLATAFLDGEESGTREHVRARTSSTISPEKNRWEHPILPRNSHATVGASIYRRVARIFFHALSGWVSVFNFLWHFTACIYLRVTRIVFHAPSGWFSVFNFFANISPLLFTSG